MREGRMWVCSLPCEEGVLEGVLGNRVGWEVWSLVMGLREGVAGVIRGHWSLWVEKCCDEAHFPGRFSVRAAAW